jgi:hypothetical protein
VLAGVVWIGTVTCQGCQGCFALVSASCSCLRCFIVPGGKFQESAAQPLLACAPSSGYCGCSLLLCSCAILGCANSVQSHRPVFVSPVLLPSVCVCLQHLKHRAAQLEASSHQAEGLRQENSLLRQQLMDMEAAVSDNSFCQDKALGRRF